MLIASEDGADNISDLYQANDAGVFDVPQDIGEHLLRFPGWRAATDEEAASFTAPDVKTTPRPRGRKPAASSG